MENEEKVRENRLRRMAKRQGLQLRKSPRRDPRAIDYGGYMLVDSDNYIVLGATVNDWDANIDEVEIYLLGGRQGLKEAAALGKNWREWLTTP